MDLWEAISTRSSIRQFGARGVNPSTVKKILETGVRAPSAGNRQSWHFVVVRRAGIKEELSQAAFGQGAVAQAPVVIVICADPERSATKYGSRGRELYCLQDTAAAAGHMLLAATALGLGTCWVGAFDERSAALALDLPEHLRPVAMILLGYAAEGPLTRTTRRPLHEVVSFVE